MVYIFRKKTYPSHIIQVSAEVIDTVEVLRIAYKPLKHSMLGVLSLHYPTPIQKAVAMVERLTEEQLERANHTLLKELEKLKKIGMDREHDKSCKYSQKAVSASR
ncbi:hypothetical protein CWC12_10610 [Pseudoalteromonas ruthenica]|nr:hypothetical protein CWC12_10610 [Pseudoalteromonas ruthenica]TMP21526.1 hypothetical protein CWC06_18435 [Pseudoalteromonas ruthenica]